MERLWAPWRMQFVEKGGSGGDGCIFCNLPAETGEEADRRNLILGRSAFSFVMLNKYPYTSGHLLVVPKRHTAVFEDLPAEELADLSQLLQQSAVHLKKAYKPDGMNLGMNLGSAAGAGIAHHLHWHAVPRWAGDTNFMPVTGDVRVMVEHLDGTWERLRPLFAAG
jgi:ATP adenylyltransferase